MTLEELEENEDEFGEDDEAAMEMYRWAVIVHRDATSHTRPYALINVKSANCFLNMWHSLLLYLVLEEIVPIVNRENLWTPH